MLVKDYPEGCWESIFRFLGQGNDLESVSVVCKQFLSITNRIRISLTIRNPTIIFLPRLLSRFLRLKVIDLSHFTGELEGLLHLIAQSGLDLDLVNVSNQKTLPVDGLRELGSKMINLRVLICSNIGSLRDSHLIMIAYCFPFLEELDISFPLDSEVSDFGILRSLEEISFFTCFKITQVGIASAFRVRPSLASISFNIEKKRIHGPGLTPLPINMDLIDSLASLKRLNAVDLSNSFISDEFLISLADSAGNFLKKLVLHDCCNFTFSGISYVLSKCQYIQCLDLGKADFLTDQCIKELSMFLLNLTSINLSGCCQLTNSSFFILTRNCKFLNEIKMERTYIGVDGEQDFNSISFLINLQVKEVYFGDNVLLNDASLSQFSSICPYLQFLDLKACEGISQECVVEVMKRCCKLRNLNLAYTGIEKFEINFEVSQLEVLNLSGSSIEDETLFIISKLCIGLLFLDIQDCCYITTKGVREVIENCRGLKELNLKNCRLVDDDFVLMLTLTKPSLRTIITPSGVEVYY
ncbi:uncharacterized protein LOC131601124 isoform X2 [Vicia villosa]|uniref:uncharacterized protein LOC131601124 isoform X2 n=1 Tax=Vicia villosa TaxID=3911 RepID=UPI00273C3DAA|nr:uncharacterized protein LOC131601124 isoform X2 [Vicia villosa]